VYPLLALLLLAAPLADTLRQWDARPAPGVMHHAPTEAPSPRSLAPSLPHSLPLADTLRQAPMEGALPEVSVVGTRVAADPAEAPARVTALGPETIAATGSRTVADLLERATTAHVRRYGPGGLASVSMRGTGASQTLVLLDGHRIADPQLGQLDLSLLPAVLLEGAELLHGAGSALHGTDGMGGVLALRTRRPEGTRLALSSTLGAFGERRASGLAEAEARGLRVLAAGEVLSEEGDFPYFDPRLGANGETARRTGADRQQGSLFLRGEGEVGRSRAYLAAWTGTAERGVPGSVGAPIESRQKDRHLRLWGGTVSPIRGGTLRVGGLVQRAALRYQEDEGRTWLGSVEAEAQQALGRWLLAAGATAGGGSAAHQSLDADAREARLGAFVAGTGDWGSILLYPALRADLYLRDGPDLSALSPRLGASWRPLAALPLRLKAATGTAFRAPTFNDRFWRYADPGVPAGDPALRPERGWTADLGAHLALGPASAEVTGYLAGMRGQIVWLPGPTGAFAPQNVGRTRTRGLEASLALAPLSLGPAHLDGRALYALTDARDVTGGDLPPQGRALPFVPRHQAKGMLGAVLSLDARTRLRLDLGAQRVGARPVTADGSIAQPAYAVADARLGLRRTGGSASGGLSLGVENLFDARYAVMRGYPMPPRHLRLHLHLQL
jgi:vitamin B12 transporter